MRYFIIFALCCFSFAALSQDERYYRDIFTGDINKHLKKPFMYKVEVESKKYMIDLDRDGIEDSFQLVKKDGVDFIRINDSHGVTVFEDKLEVKGGRSRIFKANFFRTSDDADTLVLHYFEGQNDAAIFESSARLYFLTIRGKSLKQITLTKGPFFWSERESAADKYYKYWNKRYSVNIIDYNKDGRKEISVSYNKSSQVYFYLGDGVWGRL